MKKLVADRLKAQVAGLHPDAEVLSAFAENALSAKERESVLQHLSTCSDCRDITFLASPLAAELQPVVSSPRARPLFALRWGTLAACVLIAAVFLVSRHQTPRTQQLAKSAPQTATPAPVSSYTEPAIVAAEKTPAELSEMRDKLPAKVTAPAVSTGHAEPKHITAKPQGSMTFADSGEVRLKEPATVANKVEPVVVQSLPSTGRSVADLKQMAPVTASSNTQTPVSTARAEGGAIGANANWAPQAVANAPARKDLAAYGYVTGTVLDASGAVVPNARVTAISPLGTQTAISDQAGKYAFDQLQAGNYQLKFDAPGFRQVQYQQVAVLPNQAANMDVKLQPGATTESVEVSAAAVPAEAHADSALQIQQQNVNGLQAGQAQAELSRMQTAEVRDKKRARGAPAMAKSASLLVWQWSLSPEGLVQRSADQGATWQVVRIAKGLTFRAISSFANHVWVGGSGGVLYHSADTGNHWTRVAPAAQDGRMQGDVTQIQFADPQHGTVTTSTAEVWATADGGQTWTRQ